MKKVIIPIIIFIGISININAQEKTRKELKGDKQTFNYSYEKAIDTYTHAKQLSVEGQRMLAESYHKIGRNTESEAAYLKLIGLSGSVLPEDYYNYAMVLKINGKYDESNQWMDKFLKLKPEDLRAKSYAANKEDLSLLLKDDGKYKIEHLDINTDADDFGACYFKNSIVFSSTREKPKMIVRKYNWTGMPFWDMYISEIEDGKLKTPKQFDRSMNGKLHDGPASFSNDGNFIAFTRNHYKDKSKDKVVELQIWFSTFKDERWSEPEPFIHNAYDYSVGQPCLTADGKNMYFTSDMPGGFGGADIYRVTKDGKGVWGKPENMGDRMNTEGDEMFPFFEEQNKMLFFASDGRFGLGGLDVFVCALEDYGFGQVINAGSPLNTQYDDFAVAVNNTMTKGYFSSNRTNGSGSDDIYSFDILKGLKRNNEVISEVNKTNGDIIFTVDAPKNITAVRRVRETFPIRNYVFFDLGSTEIPDRYVLLKKDQVKDFKEDQLEVFTPKHLSGRSARQMTAYYNVLNILGDRMGKNPAAAVRLTGASMEGDEDGMAMAKSVKDYLVSVFGIKASRITTEGRIKPRIPSEKAGFKNELELLREGDHRVSIWSETPEILMQFQSGPDAPLKPVTIVTTQEAPLDSYVSFYVDGGKDTIKSWTLEIQDEQGKKQSFGPYYLESASIPGNAILGSRAKGDYKVTMTGHMNNGITVKKDTTVQLVLWASSIREEGMRFSIIYEFNESTAISIYEKYLTEVVVPKIPNGATVIIAGFTDVVGLEAHNLKLSKARANDVKNIIEKELTRLGKTDVKLKVNGFGEDENLSPFENKLPEERFYNRTVVIDVIPKE